MPQVQREAAKVNERHGWFKPGDAWGYRRHAYRSGLLALDICIDSFIRYTLSNPQIRCVYIYICMHNLLYRTEREPALPWGVTSYE